MASPDVEEIKHCSCRSPIGPFILGLMVTWLIILPFYIASMWSNSASNGYLTVFCKQAATYPHTN